MAASNTFYLKIISANRVFYSGRCRSLIVPEYDGQKEILAHHEDMVIAIDDGEMRFQPEGSENWEYAVVGMGFVEIVNNRVTLLVEDRRRSTWQEPEKPRKELRSSFVRSRASMSIITHAHLWQEPWLV